MNKIIDNFRLMLSQKNLVRFVKKIKVTAQPLFWASERNSSTCRCHSCDWVDTRP